MVSPLSPALADGGHGGGAAAAAAAATVSVEVPAGAHISLSGLSCSAVLTAVQAMYEQVRWYEGVKAANVVEDQPATFNRRKGQQQRLADTTMRRP